jgi:hypothetical protein
MQINCNTAQRWITVAYILLDYRQIKVIFGKSRRLRGRPYIRVFLLGSDIEAGSERTKFEINLAAGTILWVGTGIYLSAGRQFCQLRTEKTAEASPTDCGTSLLSVAHVPSSLGNYSNYMNG